MSSTFPYPKILHTYWDGSSVSFLILITFLSFHEHHPDWKINCFYPKVRATDKPWKTGEQRLSYSGKDYLKTLHHLPYVTMVEIDVAMFGVDSRIPEVIKSDLIRYYLLYEYGGVWSDTDVIYIKSLEPVFANATDASLVRVFGNNSYYPIGFLAGKKGHLLYKNLFELAKKNIDVEKYQSIGSPMLSEHFESNLVLYDGSVSVHRGYVYLPFEWFYASYGDLFNDNSHSAMKIDDYIRGDTFGIHWFNGCDRAKQYQNGIDTLINNGSIVSVYAKKYLSFPEYLSGADVCVTH